MVKVSVMYPNSEGARFDHAYYASHHIPLTKERMGAACLRVEIDRGLANAAPGAPVPYLAIGHLYCESIESFQAGFRPHAKELMGDIPNYTNIQPVVQFSEVVTA